MRPAGSAVLAVIDLQNVFADPASPWCAPRFGEIIEPVAELVAAFTGRTVFTRFVPPQVPAGAWRAYYQQWPFALTEPRAEQYQLVERFARPERLISASTFGKWTPELAALVGEADLVLAGVSTDCCVLSTALAAADAGTRVLVAEQACAGADDASHARALAAMAMYAPLIEVLSVPELLAAAARG